MKLSAFRKNSRDDDRIRRRENNLLRALMFLASAGLFLAVIFYLFGRLFRPDIYSEPHEYDQAFVESVKSERDVSLSVEDPLILHVQADYSQGENASWFPRGETPFLRELVEAGRIPPVEERVGPEPAVMRGVDGIGNYGGTWHRAAASEDDIFIINFRLSGSRLLRWSPEGYPLMPHLAKGVEVSEDLREYTFHLRRGVRWSDGHPFTADDILYWWEDEVWGIWDNAPGFMTIQGDAGDVKKIDDYTVKFVFPHPHGLFLERAAMTGMWSPRHYLLPFHPELGDPGMVEQMMETQGVQNPRTAYFRLKDYRNPEHPRLWPWVPREHQRGPPFEFVRNPFYWVVDEEGNQLPYVDRILFHVRSHDMISVMASSGDVTMQLRHIRFDDYTLYMELAEENNYEVYHWYPGERSEWTIFPNLNRRVDPARPETRWKNKLINDKRFRQALSLAINREDIIEAYYSGLGEPAQIDPGPESPFHHYDLFKSFTEFNPERANELLDEIGLTEYDSEGYRTFPDGRRMTFYLHVTDLTGRGPAQFVLDDWERVGVRVILRDQARPLWQAQHRALEHDFSVWTGESEIYPLLSPRNFVPTGGHFAPAFARWYGRGGLYGEEDAADLPGAAEPPESHPLRRALHVYEEALGVYDIEDQTKIFREALDIAAENVWTISITTPPPQLVIVQRGFKNVPRKALTGAMFNTPANTGIETYFFEEPAESPGAVARMKRAMVSIRPDPGLSVRVNREIDRTAVTETGKAADRVIRYLVWGTILTLIILAALKHPFIGRRFIILIPTTLIISFIIFSIIQMPPGDYITNRIAQLEMQGDEDAIRQIEELRGLFYMDRPFIEQYARWLGLYWFRGFNSSDRGLLQGHLGLSMEHIRPITDVVGDRILLTFLISLFTICFTWAVAVPIGIYSAVKQYSAGDYIFTFLGFLGLSFPNFLLALVLMYVSSTFFGVHVGGLFSPEYMAQPEWSWGKFVDLLQHIWVPVFVIGTAGTAGMIRIMRANLLDELEKPYVVTARAKGVKPIKLLFKYPVRLAINPFISGIGNIFPQLVSGGAIVALVLGLPTVGPLLLSSMMNLDMYMAGSMLMVLSLLTVFGTLVSDLLLMCLDPRIRMRGN